jgi:hypothetical protein
MPTVLNNINKISSETRQKLIQKSVKGMANNPSEKGATAKQVKNAMVDPFIGDNLSILTEVNRIVDETNDIFNNGVRVQEEIYYGNNEPDINEYKTWITDADVESVEIASAPPVQNVQPTISVLNNTNNIQPTVVTVDEITVNDNTQSDITVIDNTI